MTITNDIDALFDRTQGAPRTTPEIIRDLRIDGEYIHCPFCSMALRTSERPEGSNFWSHVFFKKHEAHRPDDPEFAEALAPVITRTARRARKAARQAETDAKIARAAAKQAEQKRLAAKHTVTGAFLDEIVEEMEALILLMEPYHSQGGAQNEARAKIAEIRAISGQPLEQ